MQVFRIRKRIYAADPFSGGEQPACRRPGIKPDNVGHLHSCPLSLAAWELRVPKIGNAQRMFMHRRSSRTT